MPAEASGFHYDDCYDDIDIDDVFDDDDDDDDGDDDDDDYETKLLDGRAKLQRSKKGRRGGKKSKKSRRGRNGKRRGETFAYL